MRYGQSLDFICDIWPPLSEKSFPVRRVTQKKASREVGIFFLISFVYKLECTRGKREKTSFFLKDEKTFYPQVLVPVGRWRGTLFYLRMAFGTRTVAFPYSREVCKNDWGGSEIQNENQNEGYNSYSVNLPCECQIHVLYNKFTWSK